MEGTMGTQDVRSSRNVQAGRFIEDWLVEHRARMQSPDEIDGLALKLLSDAYQRGAPIGEVLSATGGDPFSFLHGEARRQRRPGASRLQHLVQRLSASIPSLGRSHTG
jgi:hypothetical protein